MNTRVVEPILITHPERHASSPLGLAARVQRLERLTRLMDEAIEIPLLGTRVGLDALLGLLPGVGDLVSGAISVWILKEARELGASRWLLARMAWNVGVDATVGAVPLAGDVFDAYYKANRKNVEMLKSWLRKKGRLVDPV